MSTLKKKLRNIFGHKEYKSALQEKACEVVFSEKSDALICALQDTEKSLCMQLPSVAQKSKFTVVITPTRDFAKSQVNYLKTKNIPAFYWNACSSTRAKNYIKNEMTAENPKIKLLYITYHQVLNSHIQFKLMQAKQNVSKFIIDEADYLSPLTSNFRSEFIKLSSLKKKFSDIPIVAFITAATEQVAKHVIQVLQLNSPMILDNKIPVEKEFIEHDVILLDSDSGESVEYIGEASNTKKEHQLCEHLVPSIKLFKLCKYSREKRLVGEQCPSCINSKEENIAAILKQSKMLMADFEVQNDTVYISD